MANTIVTHPAQKLNIKHIKGAHFKLVVNIKNSDGSDYDFQGVGAANSNVYTNNSYDLGQFVIMDSNGDLIQTELYGTNDLITLSDVSLGVTVENGKLTVEFTGVGQPFSPPEGRYKYILKTSYISSTNGNVSQHKVWLYGDFIVEDVLPYDNNNDYGV